MCNNLYMREKALEELLRDRIREIENHRRVALATGHRNGIRSIIGRCGTFLVVFGTHLEQVERHEVPARV